MQEAIVQGPIGAWSILDRYGIPVGLSVGLLWAFWKLVWPFMLNQVQGAQERLDRSQTQFLIALERRDQIMKEEFAALTVAITARMK